MSLKIDEPVVSCQWLKDHLEEDTLVILDVTIPKVTSNKSSLAKKEVIKNALFFDLKNQFSDQNSKYPNTVLSPEAFEFEVQKLGINKNSCIVVYDDLGIYSSPRAWWLFQLMGFTNVAVLNGGLPEWISLNFPILDFYRKSKVYGNFKANYQPEKIQFTKSVLSNITKNDFLVLDARSKERFFAEVPEPRADVKGGHIPSSNSLPYSELILEGKLKSKAALETIFTQTNPEEKPLVFSCGTGITAAILALGASIAGYSKTAIYDGSWTEWGSTKNLPIIS